MVIGTLSVLILQIGLTARGHVEHAQGVSDRMDVELALQSREAQLAFSLLTNPWMVSKQTDESSFTRQWDFSGRPFSVDDTIFEIQDLAGLRPMPQDESALDSFPLVLQSLLGLSVAEATTAADKLKAEMREPDWVTLQSYSDFVALGVLTADQVERLRQFTTLYPNLVFNPLTAPAEILALQFDSATLAALSAARARSELDQSSFVSITGIDDEFNSFSVGAALLVKARVTRGRALASKQGVWIVNPYDKEPLRYWSRQRVRTEN
jgi:hypothetical protein